MKLPTFMAHLRCPHHCVGLFVLALQLIERNAPGYAIGGLAGGETKDMFWRVVAQCAAGLPPGKPRYVMGIGYPLDVVVCSTLGADMYDSVYPTRTARFGVALVDEGEQGWRNPQRMSVQQAAGDGMFLCSSAEHTTLCPLCVSLTLFCWLYFRIITLNTQLAEACSAWWSALPVCWEVCSDIRLAAW
jgi:hypothetical protein